MSSIEHFRAAYEIVTKPGSYFEVGRVSVAGMSLLGYVQSPQSMRELWLKAASFGDAEYLVYLGERLSYKNAAQQVAGIIILALLRDPVGVGKGE